MENISEKIGKEIYDNLIKKLEYVSNLSGGSLRKEMGAMVENLIDNIWNSLSLAYPNVNAAIHIGNTKPISTVDCCGNKITESVDRHCYINDKLVMAIECKTYLDKCFMQRADSDFHLMKTSNNFKSIIVAIEDGIASCAFNFFMNQGNIDKTFFLANSKRNSLKHISRNRDNIELNLIIDLVKELEQCFIN